MSRCFPFPPPGYERKHRPEDLDLLKEVKRKEKKHKEKKDKEKEKKKDKEKEKDGNEEKHRDKKDRKGKHKDKKEKHRDKKKNKEDRAKDKEKSSISEESTVAGKLEEKSGEKLHHKGHCKDGISFLDEGKYSILSQGQNGAKPSQNSLSSQGNQESKFVKELDRRIRDDENGRRSQLPERAVMDRKDHQEMSARAAVRNSSGVSAEEKGDNITKKIERKIDHQGLRNDIAGNMMVQNRSIADSKVERIPRPVVEQNGRRLEDKEKYNEPGVIKMRDKHKDRDKEKKKRKDDKAKVKTENKKSEPDKLKHGVKNDLGGSTNTKSNVLVKDANSNAKKSEPEKLKDGGKNDLGGFPNTKSNVLLKDANSNAKKSEPDKLKDGPRNDLGGFTNTKSNDLLKDANSNAAFDGNIRKRKDTDTNGFLHESEIRPNKIQKPAPPHQSIENGRKLEPFRTPIKSSHDKHSVPNSVRLENGIIEAQKPSPSKQIPLAAAAAPVVSDHIAKASKKPRGDSKAFKVPKMKDPIAEASRQPPHPDTKYLAELLTVPTMADWAETDDQDWLFSKKDPSSQSKAEPFGANNNMCVWSEAMQIQSADVCALPYVIPY